MLLKNFSMCQLSFNSKIHSYVNMIVRFIVFFFFLTDPTSHSVTNFDGCNSIIRLPKTILQVMSPCKTK